MNVKAREEVSVEDSCYVASKNAHGAVIDASYSIIRSLSFFSVLALPLFFLQNVPFRHSPSCRATQRDPGDLKSLTHSSFSFMWWWRHGTDAGFSRHFTHRYERNRRGKNNRETLICLQELSVKSKASGVRNPTNLLILNSERHHQLHGGQHLHSGGRRFFLQLQVVPLFLPPLLSESSPPTQFFPLGVCCID